MPPLELDDELELEDELDELVVEVLELDELELITPLELEEEEELELEELELDEELELEEELEPLVTNQDCMNLAVSAAQVPVHLGASFSATGGMLRLI